MFRSLKKRLNRSNTDHGMDGSHRGSASGTVITGAGTASANSSRQPPTKGSSANTNTFTNPASSSTVNTTTTTSTSSSSGSYLTSSSKKPHTQSRASASSTFTKKKKKPSKYGPLASFDPLQKITELASFDACVEAADALATMASEMTSNASQSSNGNNVLAATRIDPATGLADPTVLVSPNGDVLLLPQEQSRQQHSSPLESSSGDDEPLSSSSSRRKAKSKKTKALKNSSNNNNTTKNTKNQTHISHMLQNAAFSELLLHGKDDYESAIFLGNDLKGDAAWNGFSAAGWSLPAATVCLDQTATALAQLCEVVEDLAVTKQTCAGKCADAAAALQTNNSITNTNTTTNSTATTASPTFSAYSSRNGGAAVMVHKPRSPDEWEYVDPVAAQAFAEQNNPATASPSSLLRVGPLNSMQSSLQQAVLALEEYHSSGAKAEAQHWRNVTMPASANMRRQSNNYFDLSHSRCVSPANGPTTTNNNGNTTNSATHGILPTLQTALEQFQERSQKRSTAILKMNEQIKFHEERVRAMQDVRHKSWENVYQAEDAVTARLESLLKERSKQRERQRIAQLRQDEAARGVALLAANGILAGGSSSGGGGGGGGSSGSGPTATGRTQKTAVQAASLGATSEEIWDIVSEVAQSMDDGSFEPMDLPSAPLSAPLDKSSVAAAAAAAATNKNADANPSELEADDAASGACQTNMEPSLPVISRERIELELDLPHLRSLAMQADDNVQDAADALLNALSGLDTLRRSARLSAETCLVSAANAHATCIKSLVAVERELLTARMQALEQLEKAVEEIDVRSDLNSYICLDKTMEGGASILGDEDDGGVASALAVLSSHVDGAPISMRLPRGRGGDSHSSSYENYDDSDMQDTDETTSEEVDEALRAIFAAPGSEKANELESAIELLCKVASNPLSRARRSAICYSLNSKRGSHAEIKSQEQFDGLCQLFSAVLSGCEQEGGASIAKMCMMLSQSFYFTVESVEQPESGTAGSRKNRQFVKTHLTNHPLWSKDEFWDEVLGLQITESLRHSGVMASFESSEEPDRNERKSEWTQMRKTKWYDLALEQRIEAASQVHSVVFAQLGALAHSMMEFGCGLERACGFVRRMSVRNQLPFSQRTMLLKHLVSKA